VETLSKRHIAQIIRRKMIQKSKESKKLYCRKEFKNNFKKFVD
jgi:hypothetical protein